MSQRRRARARLRFGLSRGFAIVIGTRFRYNAFRLRISGRVACEKRGWNRRMALGAAEPCVQKSEELLARVEEMRINQVIYPPQDDVLNALASCAPSEVRAVILGQDPYHGPGQAMGLSFSVPAGEKLPPSLRNIYKEMVSDLGCGMPKSGDLTPWANQGVLLLNTTLTVREHEAASHAKLGWQVLTSHVVKACFELPQPVVFLAWGRHAQQLIEKAAASAGVNQDFAAEVALCAADGPLGILTSGELCLSDRF